MKTKGLLTALAFVSLALTACAPGVQPLLDEYNALFDSVTERGKEQVADDDGNLQETYDVPNDHTLNLHAPAHCSSYQWKMEADPGFPDTRMPEGFDINEYGGATEWLKLDLKKAGFMPGNYVLSYTAERGEQQLTDTCKVLVRLAVSSASGS